MVGRWTVISAVTYRTLSGKMGQCSLEWVHVLRFGIIIYLFRSRPFVRWFEVQFSLLNK